MVFGEGVWLSAMLINFVGSGTGWDGMDMKATVMSHPTPREPSECPPHSVFRPTGRRSASLGSRWCLEKEFSGKRAKIPLDVPAQEVLN